MAHSDEHARILERLRQARAARAARGARVDGVEGAVSGGVGGHFAVGEQVVDLVTAQRGVVLGEHLITVVLAAAERPDDPGRRDQTR